ncbi:MAG: hypothetical protein Q4B33_05790 [Fusobacterium sp.]|nr:hypothetical protein [Fusobacterium sp.]
MAKKSLEALKAIALEEVQGVTKVQDMTEVRAKATYAISKNKGTVIKGTVGTMIFNYGLENDSILAQIGGGLMVAASLWDSGKIIDDFNDFDSEAYMLELEAKEKTKETKEEKLKKREEVLNQQEEKIQKMQEDFFKMCEKFKKIQKAFEQEKAQFSKNKEESK